MHIEIQQSDLLKMVSLAQTVAEKRTNMPHLVNLLLEADGDELKIYATDLEISLTTKGPAKVLQSGRATIHAKHFFEIIKELQNSTVSLKTLDNHWIQIEQKRYCSKLHGNDPKEYPVFPVVSGCNFLEVPSKTLKSMIEKVIFSVSNDATRYHLNGVYLERILAGDQINLKMIATDGHRLALMKGVVDKNVNLVDPNQLQGVIIPRKGVIELSKILETVDKSVELAIEGAQLVIRHEKTILLIRLIEGKYPNYQQFFPQEIHHSVTVSKEMFLSAIKRISFHAHQKSKSILLEVANDKITISSSNSELGDAVDEIEADYHGTGYKVHLNARYLLDILTASTSQLICLQLRDVNSPLIIKPAEDSSHLCVVMPMRG